MPQAARALSLDRACEEQGRFQVRHVAVRKSARLLGAVGRFQVTASRTFPVLARTAGAAVDALSLPTFPGPRPNRRRRSLAASEGRFPLRNVRCASLRSPPTNPFLRASRARTWGRFRIGNVRCATPRDQMTVLRAPGDASLPRAPDAADDAPAPASAPATSEGRFQVRQLAVRTSARWAGCPGDTSSCGPAAGDAPSHPRPAHANERSGRPVLESASSRTTAGHFPPLIRSLGPEPASAHASRAHVGATPAPCPRSNPPLGCPPS